MDGRAGAGERDGPGGGGGGAGHAWRPSCLIQHQPLELTFINYSRPATQGDT